MGVFSLASGGVVEEPWVIRVTCIVNVTFSYVVDRKTLSMDLFLILISVTLVDTWSRRMVNCGPTKAYNMACGMVVKLGSDKQR